LSLAIRYPFEVTIRVSVAPSFSSVRRYEPTSASGISFKVLLSARLRFFKCDFFAR
jgi:hypothetical protein